MDTSKTYIKMCTLATKIQKLRPIGQQWHLGDWFMNSGTITSIVVAGDNSFFEYELYDRRDGDIWLPSQDTLQGMLGDYSYTHGVLSTIKQTEYWDIFNSWEQFWLAIVMKKKYKKTWDVFSKKGWVAGADPAI